jgi:hypothetical protein
MRIISRRGLERCGWELLAFMALCVIASTLHSCDDGGYGHRVFAQTKAATYGLESGMALPDRDVTPGAADPLALADPSGKAHRVDGLERNVCAKDFRATAIRATIRNFPKLKKAACAEYSLKKCDGSVEGDHLISIEIGGCPNCLTNLWPQPMDEARIKDHQVEDVLPKLVCSGKITLKAAQECIASDWVACQKKVKQLQGIVE